MFIQEDVHLINLINVIMVGVERIKHNAQLIQNAQLDMICAQINNVLKTVVYPLILNVNKKNARMLLDVLMDYISVKINLVSNHLSYVQQEKHVLTHYKYSVLIILVLIVNYNVKHLYLVL